MDDLFGYHVTRDKSSVGGTGVFVRALNSALEGSACVQKGQIVGLYPGVLYLPHQPILFQSIFNQFIFRCIDGIHIDGNDRRLSKMIYRSCLNRDRIGFSPIADESWLTSFPLNPLNVGQYVNNQSKGFESNVAYQELIVASDLLPLQARRFIPNLWYRPPPDMPLEDVPIKLVALVATRNINVNEELFSDYFTLVS